MSSHFHLSMVLACFFLTIWAPTSGAEIVPTHLSADPPSSRTVELEEMWRIGGWDDEEVLLGIVGRGVMDEQGNTYLLDRQLSQVLVINLEGDLVTTLGREGEGPGEMTRPADVFLMNDQQIGISQGFPGKIILINADNTPGGIIPIGGQHSSETGGFFFMGRAHMHRGHLVVHSGRGVFDLNTSKNTTVHTLALIDAQGNTLTSFVEHRIERDMTRQEYNEKKDFSELDTWALGGGISGNGVLYTAPLRDEYVVRVRDLEGHDLAQYRRPFSPRQRNQKDKDDLTANMRVIIDGVNQEIHKEVLNNDPAIMNMVVAADGRLFVQNCFSQRKLLPEGVANRFDVISAEGQFVEELTLEVPEFNKEQDRLIFLDGQHWLLIRNFDSAQAAMRAGFGGDEGEEDLEDLEDAEPLEIILYSAGD